MRIAIALVKTAVTVDEFLINTYERLVADPLQQRGISLTMQTRSLFIAAAFLCLLQPQPSFWNLPPAAMWAYNGFLRYPYLDVPPSDTLFRNPARERLSS